MNSKEIKNFLRTTLGLKCPLSVTTNATLNPYINARIRPTAASLANHMGNLEYPAELPVAFRQCCLAVVYGAESPVAKQAAGGNIMAHSIAMRGNEWGLAVALFLAKSGGAA